MLAALFKILPRKEHELEAKLAGVNGFTGYGGVEFTQWQNGVREFSVELRGIAGKFAEIYTNGVLTQTLDVKNGRAGELYDTRKNHDVPNLIAGDIVEIWQNGDPILTGTLQAER